MLGIPPPPTKTSNGHWLVKDVEISHSRDECGLYACYFRIQSSDFKRTVCWASYLEVQVGCLLGHACLFFYICEFSCPA